MQGLGTLKNEKRNTDKRKQAVGSLYQARVAIQRENY